MPQTTNEVIGQLRAMAMDTLRPDRDRAFFRDVADRLNELSKPSQKD